METLERRQEERAAAARRHSAAESLGIWRFRADKAEAEAIQETEAQEAETIQKSGDQEVGDKKPGDRQETGMISPQSPSKQRSGCFQLFQCERGEPGRADGDRLQRRIPAHGFFDADAGAGDER